MNQSISSILQKVPKNNYAALSRNHKMNSVNHDKTNPVQNPPSRDRRKSFIALPKEARSLPYRRKLEIEIKRKQKKGLPDEEYFYQKNSRVEPNKVGVWFLPKGIKKNPLNKKPRDDIPHDSNICGYEYLRSQRLY